MSREIQCHRRKPCSRSTANGAPDPRCVRSATVLTAQNDWSVPERRFRAHISAAHGSARALHSAYNRRSVLEEWASCSDVSRRSVAEIKAEVEVEVCRSRPRMPSTGARELLAKSAGRVDRSPGIGHPWSYRYSSNVPLHSMLWASFRWHRSSAAVLGRPGHSCR